MSLDITLRMKGAQIVQEHSGIFVRKDGQTVEISVEEWNELHPGETPAKLDSYTEESDIVFDANITHNLRKMAEKAGIYQALWRPEEIGAETADSLILLLSGGLVNLISNPEFFKTFNPENGWGTYEQLVQLVKDYLKACIDFPEAIIEVDR